MFLEFIALKDSVADPEGRSGGCIHTPTLCSKFLSYLWVRFTTCLTPEFLKQQERIVALKWQGKRKGWGRALRWIYSLASYCLFGIRVNLFHCWTASLCFVLILTLKRLSTLTNNYLTVPFRLSTTVNLLNTIGWRLEKLSYKRTFKRSSFEGVCHFSFLIEISKPLTVLWIWKLRKNGLLGRLLGYYREKFHVNHF